MEKDTKKSGSVQTKASTVNKEQILQAVINASLTRSNLLRTLLDGPKKDLNFECGYPDEVEIKTCKEMYKREGIAKRVVNCMAEESWAVDPEVYETEDTSETAFEKAWKELRDKHNIFHFLERVDKLSGIGRFGLLLLGIDDGLELREPVESINEKGEQVGSPTHKLLYLRAFDESVVTVQSREEDAKNPRYGQPVIYNVTFQEPTAASAGTLTTLGVHWTRAIHVADGREMSEVYGTSRMEDVFNRLMDVRKILSGSPEMFWKGAFPGIAFEVNPELQEAGVEIDATAVREEFENYMNGLQRYLAITGVTAKSLSPQVSDPSPHVEMQLKAIAISKGIPQRILFGSEQAQLASSQDAIAWSKRIGRRQNRYLSPMIVRPLIDRFIAMGVLPEPTEYHVNWPDLFSPSDQEKATVAVTETDALSKYIQGGVDAMIPPDLFLMEILGKTQEEVDAIMKAVEQYQLEQEADAADEAAAAAEAAAKAGLPDPNQPPAPPENGGDKPNAGKGTQRPAPFGRG